MNLIFLKSQIYKKMIFYFFGVDIYEPVDKFLNDSANFILYLLFVYTSRWWDKRMKKTGVSSTLKVIID